MESSKYREAFVQEAREHVKTLNDLLLKLEKEPGHREYLDALFRSAHTVKGMAATMGYEQIAKLCKAVEDVLDRLRKGNLDLTQSLTNSLFGSFDLLAQIIEGGSTDTKTDSLASAIQTAKESTEPSPLTRLSGSPSTIHVKMQDLDALVDLVGELLIAKSRLEQVLPNKLTEESRHALLGLARIISELQDQTMRTRLVPVEEIFSRFPRMVRDLAQSQGKQVELKIRGSGIELDRMVIDAIAEPLLHILRNAIDHGIEASAEREELGKPQVGILRVEAFRLGDKVAIQAEDDGRGVDIEKVKAKAIEKKLVSEIVADNMTDQEVLDLLGAPGLSAAKIVTDVSGRGVGINVVRSRVEAIGGEVRIETTRGIGTRITLILPVSLSIIEGLFVRVGDERYVIPLSSILRIVEAEGEVIRGEGGREMIKLGDRPVYLVRVADELGTMERREAKRKLSVIVVEKAERLYGLVVDSVERRQQVVVKRLTGPITNSGFTNATILPDGGVAMILDPLTLL